MSILFFIYFRILKELGIPVDKILQINDPLERKKIISNSIVLSLNKQLKKFDDEREKDHTAKLQLKRKKNKEQKKENRLKKDIFGWLKVPGGYNFTL